MSERVTVNAAWLADFARDYHSLDETVEELFQRHHATQDRIAEREAENARLKRLLATCSRHADNTPEGKAWRAERDEAMGGD